MPLQSPAPLNLCIEAGVPRSPCGLPLLSPWATTVLWPQRRAGTRDLGQAVCKARYGSTLSNTNGMREGLGGHPDKGCNGTPCLSAGFPSTALCFRAPALSGVYGLAPSPRPICHIHHAGLMGSFCGTSLSSELMRVGSSLSRAAACRCVLCLCPSSPFHPSACGPPCLQGPPKAGGMLWGEMGRPRDMTLSSLFLCRREMEPNRRHCHPRSCRPSGVSWTVSIIFPWES